MLVRLRVDSSFFRRNEEVFFAVTNLAVFIFVMTGVVYETQKFHNDQITNYADALYFTVTTLTTTGFGDITLPGTVGRLISVVIMICGVTLFFNLARALLTPSKVRFPCPACGLQRHDSNGSRSSEVKAPQKASILDLPYLITDEPPAHHVATQLSQGVGRDRLALRGAQAVKTFGGFLGLSGFPCVYGRLNVTPPWP